MEEAIVPSTTSLPAQPAISRMSVIASLWPQVLIGCAVLIAWGLMQFFMVHHVVDPTMRDIIERMLGTLDASVILVLQFFFGSNSNAHRAQELLAQSIPPGPR